MTRLVALMVVIGVAGCSSVDATPTRSPAPPMVSAAAANNEPTLTGAPATAARPTAAAARLGPMPYAVYVDERDAVWITDFGANAIGRFDPATEDWLTFEHASQPANVRQLLGRHGGVWGAESAADQLVAVRTVD